MDDTPQAGGAPASAPAPASDAGSPGGAHEGKACLFCGETISAYADRCSHCTAFLPIAEGRAYKQHYFFLFCCLAMVIGGLVGYAALSALEAWIPTLLGLAAASMLYVSVADLIPGLHKRPELHHSVAQILLIGIGIATIGLAHFAFQHAH